MISKLTSPALILAALAAVAYWNSGDQPTCNESRPVYGAKACCEGHRVAGATAVAVELPRRARLSPLTFP
jgi:hypothetical protein